MTKEDFLAAYNIGHRDGKVDAYCPNDYDDIFDIKQQPSEEEKVIRIKKGTLKVRTGRYVIYDVEWLKTHFSTTEAKIYGQPNEDCISRKAAIDALWKALHEYEDKTENQFLKSKELDVADWFQHRIFVQNMSDIDRQTILNLPSVAPQSEERTEERTETHECDCISRQAAIDALHRYFAKGFNEDRWWNSTHVLDAINKVPSVTPQSETGQQKTGYWIKHKHNGKPYFKCSECLYFAPIGYSYCPGCGAKMQEAEK